MNREWSAEELAHGEELYRRWDGLIWSIEREPDIALLKEAMLCGCADAAESLQECCSAEDLTESEWDCCYELAPDSDTAYVLGDYHDEEGRVELAVKWWRRAAQAGHTEAQYCLALQYEDGIGVAQDWGWALFWYQKAADAEETRAWCNLGICYKEGKGVDKDEKKAYRLTKLAAEAGNANACYNLGNMYRLGKCVRKNYKKAFHYFQVAVDKGHVFALTNLGYCYHWGYGCEVNDEKAVDLFRRAIAAGDRDCSAFNLAHRYRKGEGVEQDYAQAWKYFRMAVAHGYVHAYRAMGYMALNGQGMPKKDAAKAVRYFRKGVKAGDRKYCHAWLARCYEQGLGVKKNIRKAYEHLREALAAGYDEKRRIKRITAKAAAAGLVP